MERIIDRAGRLLFGNLDKHKQRRLEAKYSKERANMLAAIPAPLPRSRKNLSQTSLSTNPQLQSPLFAKLPFELRFCIYELAHGGSVLHLQDKPRKILVQTRTDYDPHFRLQEQSRAFTDFSSLVPPFALAPKNLLALLRTCHAIYAEAVNIPYSANIFVLVSPLPLVYLHDYCLRPARFAHIRHLRFRWTYFSDPKHFCGRIYAPFDEETWVSFWALVGGLGLESLGVEVEYFGEESECKGGAGWVRPMLGVRGVREVGVEIRWRVGPWDSVRLEEVEGEVERAWKSERV
ncbi:hypothetical protein MMC21_007415 [Puttea exsequens]|nr:hypothetical protein [Puttea exsequens]